MWKIFKNIMMHVITASDGHCAGHVVVLNSIPHIPSIIKHKHKIKSGRGKIIPCINIAQVR
jgi:hypothetical protein